ncbi:MAG: 16S rRNA (uracil(1498)-N(3))-methyltransferase [Candidatus Nanopelagicales bacterium]|jgi:16S rRNA (uracil1498-N3)-methyltransferase|nr:16S rRNA (uracil(1498)-N(3))-methyltransferase [Candidatus Nanopelagicales bacterium]
MSAALYLVAPEVAAASPTGSLVRLDGPEGRHAVAVARTAVGERIDLADGRGALLRVVVEALDGREALLARVLDRVAEPAPVPRLVVVQALPKGERGEVAVETLTEVGVDVIVPWAAQRCVARWVGERAERGRARWVAAGRAAGKQARRARLPEVAPLASTADVLTRVAASAAAFVLHEEAGEPLGSAVLPETGDIVLVVGPEGGVAPEELAALAGVGARAVRLGPSVLRTSTAGTVAAGIVLARTSRWD